MTNINMVASLNTGLAKVYEGHSVEVANYVEGDYLSFDNHLYCLIVLDGKHKFVTIEFNPMSRQVKIVKEHN